MPFYSACVSNSDGIQIYYVRQKGLQLQLLRAYNTDKTEDANFIALYRVSSSIRKNDFYMKRKLIS